MKKLLVLLLLMFVSNSCFAWSVFGPKNYEECILENMKGVTSDEGAEAIQDACIIKFDTAEKQVECTLQKFPPWALFQLEASASVSAGWFAANIYNGSKKTIKEINIIYKSKNNKIVEYKITDLNIRPLTSGRALTEVHDQQRIKKLKWTFTAKGCD